MVLVAVAVTSAAVAAAGALWYIIRRWRRKPGQPQVFFATAAQLEELPRYKSRRPLGQMEFVMAKLHEMDQGIMSVALLIEVKTFLTDQVIIEALNHLAKRHPLLRKSIVKKENGVPIFKDIKEFKPAFVKSESVKWDEALGKELDKKFDVAEGPLWRVTYFPDARYQIPKDGGKKQTPAVYPEENIMILSFHRAILDEAFVGNVCYELVQVLNDVTANNLSEVKSFDLLPSLDVNFTRMDVDAGWYEAMAGKIVVVDEPKVENVGEQGLKAQEEGKEASNDSTKQDSSKIHEKPGEQHVQEVLTYVLEKDKNDAIVEKCKEYGVTVSAAFEVASVLAFVNDESEGAPEYAATVIEQAINLKPTLPAIPAEYLGNYSVENVVDASVPSSSKILDGFWSLARNVSEGQAAILQGQMPIVDSTQALDDDQLDRPPPPGVPPPMADAPPDASPELECRYIRIANFGSVESKHDPDNTIVLKGLFGHVSLREEGPAIGHCIALVNDRISWSLTYKPEKFSKNAAEELLKKSVDFILKAREIEMKDVAEEMAKDIEMPRTDSSPKIEKI